VDTTPEHALHCDSVDDAVVAGFGVIGANDCGLFELSYLVESEVFVETLGDGTLAVPTAILFSCNEAILFCVVHHFAAHVLIELVEIHFK